MHSSSLISQTRFYHIHHRQLVVLPHSVYYRIILVENTLAVEFILFEGTLVTLTVLEVLSSLAIEHAVMPVTFVLFDSSLPIENTPSTLNSISEVAFIPTAVTPPKGSFTVPLACFELALINVALFSCPSIDTPSFLLIEPKLAQIVISCCEIKLSLPFELPIMELPVNDLMGILEEAETFPMRTIHFGLPNVHYLWVLEELGRVEAGLRAQHNRRTVLNHKELLELHLNSFEFSPDEANLVVQVIQIKLCLLKHLFFGTLIDLQLGAHASDEQPESFIHLIDRLEFA